MNKMKQIIGINFEVHCRKENKIETLGNNLIFRSSQTIKNQTDIDNRQ